MITIPVHASHSYEVLIEEGLLSRAGKEIRRIFPAGRAMLVTDSNVNELYADTVMSSLEKAGCSPVKYVFPAGEANKNLTTVSRMLEFFAESQFTRGDYLVALGGGVVGDTAGFAASCYLRGIPFVQVPTTLLAAVDSSVGGKTGVNLATGKNLCGAFHQPSLVLFDPNVLLTLPERELASGSAEALKAGMLKSEALFSCMEQGNVLSNIPYIVSEAVKIKAALVEQDEHDTGARMLLNLGHTLGHAAEKLSGYTLPHGYAVAMGIAAMTRAAEHLDPADGISPRLQRALCALHLPEKCPYSAEELSLAALSDKKRSGDTVTLVLPKKIGECVLYPVKTRELTEIFRMGLEA